MSMLRHSYTMQASCYNFSHFCKLVRYSHDESNIDDDLRVCVASPLRNNGGALYKLPTEKPNLNLNLTLICKNNIPTLLVEIIFPPGEHEMCSYWQAD